jgi:outer membrane protein assembly factor BamE (lipoprotein component of BamABCDE complex)
MIMPYLKFLIIFIILFISSCTDNIQKNGLSITKINQIKVKIGETSKEDLNNKYGPPVFESIFNKDIVYYASHTSSYLNFNPRETKQLIVLKITLDNKNIVQNVQKYTEKDAKDIHVSNMNTNGRDNRGIFLKQILQNLKRNTIQN